MWSDLHFEKIFWLQLCGEQLDEEQEWLWVEQSEITTVWPASKGGNLGQHGSKSSGQQESEREVIWEAEETEGGEWHVWSLQLDGQQWPENKAGARVCRVDDEELGFVIRSIPGLISRPASRKLSVSLAYRFSPFFSGDIELLGSQLLPPLALGERRLMLCKRPCIVKWDFFY